MSYNKYSESLNIDCGCGPKPAPRRPAPVPCGCPGEKLPSCDNSVEIAIAQLKREIRELMKTTKARLLCQDKKIAETMVYIKNNLSNALRELLSDMQFTGELEQIIRDMINDEYVEYLDVLKTDYVFPEQFGAVGDGCFDDTVAIQAAIDYANTKGRVVALSNKTYLISAPIILNGCSIIGTASNVFNQAGSVIKCKTKDFIAIKQGSVAAADIMFGLSNILVRDALIGYELNYVVNSKFENLYAYACDTGFKLGDSGAVGSLFNEFNNLYTRDCRVGIESASSQYFNNNVFNNGYIQGSEYAMKLSVTGGYGAVNNVFNNVEFKSADGRGIILENAPNTVFNSCYFEAGGNAIRLAGYATIKLKNCIYGLFKPNNTNRDANVIYAAGGGVITIDDGVIFLTSEYDGVTFFNGANTAILQNITVLKAIVKNGQASNFQFFAGSVKEVAIKQEEQACLTGTQVIPAGQYKEIDFTYPAEFSSIPNVVTATMRGASGIVNGLFYLVSERTKTGGKLNVFNSSSSDRSISFSVYAKIV